MSRQLKLKPEAPTLRSSLIVTRSEIPTGLSDADRQTLRAQFDLRSGDVFVFWNSPAVRRVLKKGTADAQ